MSDDVRLIQDDTAGDSVKEVEPGSADDPLLTDEARAAKAAAASGADSAPETPTSTAGAGAQDSPTKPEVPAQTPETPAAVPPAPTTPPDGDALTPEDLASLERLDGFLEEQRESILKEVRADADRVISKLSEKYKTREAELLERVRALEMSGLSEEEKAALKERYALEDEKAKLEAYNAELDAQHHDLLVARLSLEYGPYGVREVDLASKSVEEMELFCAQKKADYFENMAKGAVPVSSIKAAPAAPAAETQTPSEPSDETKEAPEKSTVPAGAMAPSDTGASAPTAGPQEFDKSIGREAMRKNLENLPVETVTPGRRA